MSGKNFYLRVPQSGTSMRNPLQAAERRSCGYNRMRGRCSAKRDLYILLTTNGISSPSAFPSRFPFPSQSDARATPFLPTARCYQSVGAGLSFFRRLLTKISSSQEHAPEEVLTVGRPSSPTGSQRRDGSTNGHKKRALKRKKNFSGRNIRSFSTFPYAAFSP